MDTTYPTLPCGGGEIAMPTLNLFKLNVYVADFRFCCFVLLRRHFLVCVSDALLRISCLILGGIARFTGRKKC